MNQVQYRSAWPPFEGHVRALVIWFGVQWAAQVTFEPIRALAGQLVLSAGHATLLQPWRLITYAFWEPDFIGAMFGAVAIWLFGGELEKRWTRKKWWGVQLGAVALGGLLVTLVYTVMEELAVGSTFLQQGWHAPITALATAYCIGYWTTPMSFMGIPMNGKTLLAFFVGLGVVMAAISQNVGAIALDLAGLVVGFVATRPGGMLRDLRTRVRIWQARRHLKVVKTPESDRPDRKMMN